MASTNTQSNRSALGHIEHVIVLMFENRSFDHLLGAMPGVDGVLASNGQVKPALYNTMDPLAAHGATNPSTPPTPIKPNLDTSTSSSIPCENQLVTHDFNHDFGDGMLRDLYGPGSTGIIGGQPMNEPATTYPSTNCGFLSTLAYNVRGVPPNGLGAMTYFAWKSMKVFHTLAEQFVVCDAWHCDMPGHTTPNRAFMHCATTGDLGIDDSDSRGATTMVNRLTIFERIQEAGQTWKMYWPGGNSDTDWLNEQVLTQQYNAANAQAFNVTNVPIANFFTDLTEGTLPFYSFIMCWNDIGPDTSMHPAAAVESGENFLACIYNALRQSAYWGNTLLIVNFDENGGIYDHKPLRPASPPDYDPFPGSLAPVSTWTSDYTGQTYSFDFSVLGVRIPVLLISPWLKPGSCHDEYQNTSILRFLQDRLPNPGPSPYFLTQRDLCAPSIAPVFDLANLGSATQRTDCPSQVHGYVASPQDAVVTCGELLTDVPSKEALAAKPAPHIVDATRRYLAALPGHADSGKPITRDFATVGELRAYTKERREAALASIAAKRRAAGKA